MDDTFEPEKAVAAGIRFIAAHQRCPLLGRHGAGAGIGKQVEQHIASAKLEKVVASLLQENLTLLWGSTSEWLDALDPEWLNNGLHGKRS
jgi:hypothetical protein